ncbi:MAG: (2Fe-2S)-binding protein [Sciscionella sp.]
MTRSGALASALADASDWGPFFAVRTHDADAAPRSPWRPMRELVDDPDVLRERVFAVRAYLAAASGQVPDGVPARVAASVTHLGLVARLVSPTLGVAVHTGLSPAMDLVYLWWQPELGGAFPLSIGVVEQLDPGRVITGAVRELTQAVGVFPVSERVLWGNVASAVNGAATMAGRARPDLASRAAAVASSLLELPSLRHASTRRPDGRFQRLSCCLIYRASPTNDRGALCGDCVLATEGR